MTGRPSETTPPPPHGAPCLEAWGVSFGYGRRGRARAPLQLQDLTLRVDQGDFVGLLGPNGAGKTTLLRLLAGVLSPTAGEVILSGTRLDSLPPRERARRLAFVPQESRPAFEFRALDLVLLGRAPHLGWMGIEGPRDLAIAREALAATDAEAFAGRIFGSLSAGEKQRVLLARALAQEAPVVLLDEPTAFLDLGHQVRIYELLSRLRRERGTTLVIASHDLSLAGRHCDRLVLLKDGRIVADGPPREVLTPETVRRTYTVDADIFFPVPGGGPVVVARGTA